jgi:hypothetical protein
MARVSTFDDWIDIFRGWQQGLGLDRETVEEYNSAIRKLPGSLIAGIGRFQRKAYFRADAGSNQTPVRKWN